MLGKEHPDYARSLYNLGILYADMGNSNQSEPLYLEAKAIAERKGMADLEEKAAKVEKELAHSVTGYAEVIRQTSWQEVRAALKKDEAAIEFVRFRGNFSKATDSIIYAASVLRPGDTQPQFIPLFENR